jgi:hypothetical protein
MDPTPDGSVELSKIASTSRPLINRVSELLG